MICPYCGQANGIVKKSGALRISHEPYRSTKTEDLKQEAQSRYATLMNDKKISWDMLQKISDDLNPLKVLELFKRVSAEDAELLALHPDIGRPEDYIWQYISVPPPCIRPSVASESGNNEDDLTAKLAEIVHHNKMLKVTMERGQGIEMTLANWEVLGQAVALYINSQAPGLSAGVSFFGQSRADSCRASQFAVLSNGSRANKVDFEGIYLGSVSTFPLEQSSVPIQTCASTK